MKKQLIALLAFAAFAPAAHSQVLLNAGDSYSYEFFSLGTPTPGGVGTGVTFAPTFSAFSLGNSILIEAFEDNTSQTPWGSKTYDPRGWDEPSLSSPLHWFDNQGAVRITVISGSVTLESMTFIKSGSTATGPAIYNLQVVPVSVPEPGTVSLLALAGLSALGWFTRRK